MSSKKNITKLLFDKYYQNLCYFAYTLLGDKVLSEDFVQDAFCSLNDNLETLVPNEKVYKGFLYTAVKNKILNYHRRSKVELKYHKLKPFDELLDLDFDNAIIKSETISEINALIEKLPNACQQIFKLYYLEGFSTKEVAAELNLSVNTIKTQKLRGIRYIQSNLNPEYFALFLFVIK
ncbi:sigma-70 family RNA polymerase sigma factor [Sphingobacterium sp. WQ 366]|uniref:Sigma-70 family RNA polymerase sigma factor n=2 Tax=Sphingobacterium bovistauri TaxID=2781959 RepID=A0ABS7Z7N0_9SPHI|nr:sigma-70 family RNA polymerase sigma factor [Sphingobacterium bovistauri]